MTKKPSGSDRTLDVSMRSPEPVAIIGMSCRFPGARSPVELWELLVAGRTSVGEVPRDRFSLDEWHHADKKAPGKLMSRYGGFLEEIDQFDPYFFGISPREAEHMDPQQRLLLCLTWEALEDARIRPASVRDTRTGVFVGAAWNDYLQILFAQPKAMGLYSATGVDTGVIAGRISFAYGLRGPSLAINTGCSSSLVAVHLACMSLAQGESSVALAGAVNIMLSPQTMVSLNKFGGICPDGACKAFDARANGFAASEGAGMLVLKRLSDAERDGDPIYCTILGTAANNDGPARAMTAPTEEGQADVLRQAYRRAGVDPAAIHYVEAHGTGTAAGDPVEAHALGSVLTAGRAAGRQLRIGSVKTNLGHTQTAAGIAGMMKTALAIKHRFLPPSLHFQTPNPNIPFEELGLAVQTEGADWPCPDEPAMAGVSSFGWGATNAHAVLREHASSSPAGGRAAASGRGEAVMLPLSARSAASLAAAARAHRSLLADPGDRTLADVALSAGARTHHDHRAAVVARSNEEAIAALSALEGGSAHASVASGTVGSGARPRVVFVFPGQGSQWCGMGRELLAREPVFAEALRACDAVIRRFTDWSLLAMLERDERWLEGQRVDVVQPTLFALEVALAALWRSWGVEPDAVIGHSMGEVAAAYVAGALSLEDAARVICGRSKLALRLAGQGLMASIELPQEEVARELVGIEQRVSVAVSNSPRSTVVSGEPAAIEALLARLDARGVFCRKVKVDFASHSPQVEALAPALLDILAPLAPMAASVPMWSTVTSAMLDGQELTAEYWMRNLREPVQFARAVATLADAGHSLFIEISPHPILVPSIESTLGERGAAVGSLRRDQPERETLLGSLGKTYVYGVEPRWPAVVGQPARLVPLPPYAWDNQRYWLADGEPTARPRRRAGDWHPLLGPAIRSSRQAGTTIWQSEISVDDALYLADHRVDGAILFPGAGFVELALAGLSRGGPFRALELAQVDLREALVLRPAASSRIQLVATESGRGSFTWSVASTEGAEAPWTVHCTGRGRVPSEELVAPTVDIETLRDRLGEELDGAAFYRAMTSTGLHYGPAFQAVCRAHRGDREALVRIEAPALAGPIGVPYVVHPVLLDAALQSVVAVVPGEAGDPPAVPVAVERIRIHGAIPAQLWGHAVLRPGDDRLVADVALLDDEGRVLMEVRGLEVRRLARTSTDDRPRPLLVQTWQAAERTAPADEVDLGRWLVVGDATGVGSAAAAEIRARGGEVIEMSGPTDDAEAFSAALRAAFGPERPCRGVLHAAGIDDVIGGSVDEVERAAQGAWLSAVALVQALGRVELAPRLWLVTRGAAWVAAAGERVAPSQAVLWGLARTLRYERAELRASVVDLPAGALEASDIAALVDELAADGGDEEVAIRREGRHVARLRDPADTEPVEVLAAAGARPYRAWVERPGTLDGLVVEAFERRDPGAAEVEIEVEAAALNFRDVLIALGAIEGGRLRNVGHECTGRIVRLGEGVRDLSIGQQVLATTVDGALTTHVIAPASLTFPRPSGVSTEGAAGLLLASVSAYYGLAHVARLAAGERVLIHAAAGGVGHAAIQWAQHVGAEVFATAGSEAKRDYLRSLGVHRVSDSRSAQFHDDVLEWTGGEGVDVVLNSLSGELLVKSLELLRTDGRFVELGRRDYEQDSALGLRPFLRSLSLSFVDMKAMMERRPERWRALVLELLAHVERGVIREIPAQTFPIAAVRDGFALLAQGRNIGKVTVTVGDRSLPIRARRRDATIRPDGAYLITGGLGGLGLTVGRWLADRGAGKVVLLGRRGAETDAQRAAVAEMEARGTRVEIASADVADPEAMAGLLRDLRASGAALRGVVHAAGVLDDGLVENQSATKLGHVMAPKVRGAWNLHQLTADSELDFFVMYSSAASLLGSPGQSNYAAANAFMDALAEHRQSIGLPGLSIAWGPFREVGLAAAQENRGKRMSERGMISFDPARGLELLEHALGMRVALVGAVEMDWRRWASSYPQMVGGARLSDVLIQDEGGGGGTLSDSVRRAAPPVQQDLVESFVRDQLVAVLRLDAGRVTVDALLKTFGIDSLTGLELRARLERGLSLTSLPASIVWTYPTIRALAAHLIQLVTAQPSSAPALDPTNLSGDDAGGAGAGQESSPHGHDAGAAPREPALELPSIEPRPEERFSPFPLTEIQQAYVLGRSGAFELGTISTYFLMEFDVSSVDLERLESSFQELVDRHDQLRAVVQPDGTQRVLPDVPRYRIDVTDLRSLDGGDRERRLLETRRAMFDRTVDGRTWPLFEVRVSRTSGSRVRLHVGLDALAVDGTSSSILFHDWSALYQGQPLTPLSLRYRDYVVAQAALEETEPHRRALAYWQARVATLPPAPDLPLARDQASIASPRFVHREARLSAPTWSRFKELAADHGLTPSTAVCTVYAEVLAAWSRSSQFTLNLLALRRLPVHEDVWRLIGNFTTTTLLEVDVKAGEAFADGARRLQDQLWTDLEHGLVSGVRVLREINRVQRGGTRAAMPVVFASVLGSPGHDQSTPRGVFGGLVGVGDDLEKVHCCIRTPQVWLDHQIVEDKGALVLNWDAVEELFPDGLMVEMFQAYLERLEQLAAGEAAWQRPAGPALPAAQTTQRSTVNRTAAPVTEALLHDPFLERVAEDPGRVAVISPRRTLSYGDVDRLSDRVAAWLRDRGAGPDRLVAVTMEKGWEQVVAAIGVLKAGAAYVPVDPNLPAERLRHLLAHTETQCVLTQSHLDARLEWPDGLHRLAVDHSEELPHPAEPVRSTALPGDLAYVIYTSGSTGLPKGVMIEHRSALNTILDVNDRLRVTPSDRMLGLSSLSFDLSVYDLFGMLAAGGAIVLPAPGDMREPAGWASAVLEHEVTLWSSVPALMEMLVDHLGAQRGRPPLPLRMVMLSGDWIPLGLPPRITDVAPEAACLGLGGATEASIWSIWHPIDRIDPAWTSIPYGTPMRNQRFEVLDEGMRPRPIWVPGELYIAGEGLARGYWRDEEKTASSFVLHPVTGERLYRTGDLGRYLPDGSIEFLGRADFQVKVGGYRIELGEIETALIQIDGVRSAVAVAAGDRGARRLIAYAVPEPGAELTEEAILDDLRAKIPAYAVPQQVLLLETLPLSANGKVDRRALPDPDSVAPERSFVAPTTEVERQLVELWAEVLGHDGVSTTDNFFDLGGQSLLAVRLMGRIRQHWGIALPLATLFEHPTIEQLALRIDGDAPTGQAARPLVAMRTEGSRPPLYFVHPVGGDVFCYSDLAAAMPPDQPFYALQAGHPASGALSSSESIEMLASSYLEEIREHRPVGPYRIGGWSMGGVVAYEMGQQLRRAGERVELLTLIDVTMPPWGVRTHVDDVGLLISFARDLAALGRREVRLDAAYLRALPAEERLDHVLERARASSALPADIDGTTMAGFLARFSRNRRAMLGYFPSPYDGRLLFLRATSGGASVEVARAWARLAVTGETIDVEGDHYAVTRRETARLIAGLVATKLGEASAAAHHTWSRAAGLMTDGAARSDVATDRRALR